MAGTWLESNSESFSWFLTQKSVFWYRTPIFVNGVCSPRHYGHFGTFGLFFDFSFPCYARFREGNHPSGQNVGAQSASNSPSALSAQAQSPISQNFFRYHHLPESHQSSWLTISQSVSQLTNITSITSCDAKREGKWKILLGYRILWRVWSRW